MLAHCEPGLQIGGFDQEKMEFTDSGDIYHFPRDNHCEVHVCACVAQKRVCA